MMPPDVPCFPLWLGSDHEPLALFGEELLSACPVEAMVASPKGFETLVFTVLMKSS